MRCLYTTGFPCYNIFLSLVTIVMDLQNIVVCHITQMSSVFVKYHNIAVTSFVRKQFVLDMYSENHLGFLDSLKLKESLTRSYTLT